MSSSIASLEPLPHSMSQLTVGPEGSSLDVLKTASHGLEEGGAVDENSDVVEVGRGLANYNSAQISRVKGLNRWAQLISTVKPNSNHKRYSSYIPQLLGYADSEYVVENITIRAIE
jgi:glutamate 5-kinase